MGNTRHVPQPPSKPPSWIKRDAETPCRTCLDQHERRRVTTRTWYGEQPRPTLEELAYAWGTYGSIPDWAFARWQGPIRAATKPKRNDLRRLTAMAWLGSWLWNRVVPVPDYPVLADYPEDGGAPKNPDGDYDSHLDEDDSAAQDREVFVIDEGYTVGEWATQENLWPTLMYGIEHDWSDIDLALACRVRMTVSEMELHAPGFDRKQRHTLEALAGLRL